MRGGSNASRVGGVSSEPLELIDLYTWSTPNGRKVSIALEEFALDYEVHPVDIGADEQFDPEFLKLSPNNKIPAIVDRETNRAMMESGAILLYLAEKCDRFWGDDRWQTIEWLIRRSVLHCRYRRTP